MTPTARSPATPASIRATLVSVGAAATVMLLLLLLLTGRAASALSRSPFDLVVAPSTLSEGERATITIVPARGGDARIDRFPAADRFDLYLVSVFSPATFLTPAGTWSSTAIPIRAGVALGDRARIVVDWPRVGPPGWTLLGLVTVRGGADPVARAGWTFRPAEAWIDVGEAPRGVRARDVVVALAVLTLAGAVVVLRYARLS